MSIETDLKGHDLFKSLSIEEVNAINGFSSSKKFRKNESVHVCAAPATHVFVLLKGAIHLRLPAKSPECSMVVSKVQPGFLFGLAALFGEKRYTLTAHCVEESEVLAIEAKPLLKLLQENHHVGCQLMGAAARAYAERYHEVLRRLQGILAQIPLIE